MACKSKNTFSRHESFCLHVCWLWLSFYMCAWHDMLPGEQDVLLLWRRGPEHLPGWAQGADPVTEQRQEWETRAQGVLQSAHSLQDRQPAPQWRGITIATWLSPFTINIQLRFTEPTRPRWRDSEAPLPTSETPQCWCPQMCSQPRNQKVELFLEIA